MSTPAKVNPHATPERHLGQAVEKLASKIWYGFVENAEFGLMPKDYNKKVHGVFCPWRYYGKPDTPFGQVKIGELPSWIARRNKSPRAMASVLFRGYAFWQYKWLHVRNMSIVPIFQLAVILGTINYIQRYRHGLKHQHQYRYHW